MRFTSIAAGIVCLASVALAQPAPGSPADACCCCDISRSVIACTRSILKKDCVCAAVVCPEGAKTVWDDGKAAPTPTAKEGRMSILPVEEGTMTILPVKEEERMSILPVKEEGRMTILPVKEEGRMSILPVRDEGVMTILPVKEEGRMSILPVNEGIMSILPVKEEGRMSILPVNNDEGVMTILPVMEEGRMSILPVKEEGRMSILPVQEEGRMSILPVNDNERMTILPVQETGKMTAMPVKETGRMTIMPVKETGRMTILGAQPTPVAQAPEKREVYDNADDACCCCDISKKVMSCSRSIKKDQCMCAAVQCPKNAPKVWEDGKPVGNKKVAGKPTPVLSELPKKFITKAKGAEKNAEITAMPVRQYPCCCCNIGISKMVCEVRDTNDCVCPMVMCPQNAETIFVKAPAPTNI